MEGLSALDVKVCVVHGPKIVIAPEKLAAFQHAPLGISEEACQLETKHQEFEDLLGFMATPMDAKAPKAEKDPRG